MNGIIEDKEKKNLSDIGIFIVYESIFHNRRLWLSTPPPCIFHAHTPSQRFNYLREIRIIEEFGFNFPNRTTVYIVTLFLTSFESIFQFN